MFSAFAVADVNDSSQAVIEQTIDGLIDRNLLLYRQRNDDISVWHGTDVDLRAHLEEEKLRIRSELNTVEILSKEHPPPYWRPVAHNVKNRIRRFFAGAYVSANDLLREGSRTSTVAIGRLVKTDALFIALSRRPKKSLSYALLYGSIPRLT